jgi:branched-chain amino acid transport system substrate-binding protein
MLDRVLLGSSLVLASCVPLPQQACSSDTQCSDRFGDDWMCGAAGYCVAPDEDDTNGEPMECPTMVCEDVINVGHVSAQTGPTQHLGLGMAVGIRAAFKEVNDAGGVQGRVLDLLVRDDGYEPTNTDPAMRELTNGGDDRRALAIVGNVGTPTALVAVPIAKENDVVFHGAFTGAGVLREDPPARVVFNYRASYEQETAEMVRFLKDERDLDLRVPARNIGVLAQGDLAAAGDVEALDGYGRSGYDGVVNALAGLVAQADIPVASYERNTQNLDVAAEYFIRWLAGPDTEERDGVVYAAIIMVPTAAPAAELIVKVKDAIKAAKNDQDPLGIVLDDDERAKLASVDLFLHSVSFVGPDALQEILSGKGSQYCSNVAVTQVVPFPMGSSTGALQYQTALQAYGDSVNEVHEPGYVSFEGYLAGRLFADGLANAPSLDTNGVVVGLESLQSVEYGIGTTLSFSIDDHQASDRIWGTQLDGECQFSELELVAGGQ